MNHETINKLITENMKTVLGFALSRLTDPLQAQELLYALLKAAPSLRDDSRFYAFMWRIAQNTYVNYLRAKSKCPTQKIDSELIADDALLPQDELILKEDMRLLRRELSLLSEQYRRAIVLYYIEDFSCAQIARKLGTSTEMVKYYLFRARKQLREGMEMERTFGEKSYAPEAFEIDFWGTKAGEDSEYRAFRERRIRGNILIVAYYTPVTVQELSIELGVSVPYLEDELRLLLGRQYLLYKNGRYVTNIPIFTSECREEIARKLKAPVAAAARQFVACLGDVFRNEFGNMFENENLLRWQALMLCSHFALLRTDTKAALPDDGPYSLVNGGGGSGFVWGRSALTDGDLEADRDFYGIYNGCPSADGRGSVIAFNYAYLHDSQAFGEHFTDPLVCIGGGCYALMGL